MDAAANTSVHKRVHQVCTIVRVDGWWEQHFHEYYWKSRSQEAIREYSHSENNLPPKYVLKSVGGYFCLCKGDSPGRYENCNGMVD